MSDLYRLLNLLLDIQQGRRINPGELIWGISFVQQLITDDHKTRFM